MRSPEAREHRYEDVTWTTGLPVSAENASQIYSRYRVAAERAVGKRVLELGCGAGQGFGLMSAQATSLIGADYSTALLHSARRHYGNRVPLIRLSAECLPFADSSFDLVVFFEATYYIPDMELAFDEISRVLTPTGAVFFANHNPEQPGFVRSPHSHHYHSATEFRSALEDRGFTVEVEGTLPIASAAAGGRALAVSRLLAAARSVLERLHLVPKTLRGRAMLKRLVHGRLRVVPAELPDGFAPVLATVPLPTGMVRGFRAFYVFAVRGENSGRET
ncbi:MAG: putative methyltransferase [Gemmatimonadetes bacterium]|nr:putative methyltransferase [Gemmatimonadota bacterium]